MVHELLILNNITSSMGFCSLKYMFTKRVYTRLTCRSIIKCLVLIIMMNIVFYITDEKHT